MSGRKLKKGKTKQKRISKLNGLDIDLGWLIKMTNEYLKDLVTEQEPVSLCAGSVKFKRFRSLSD